MFLKFMGLEIANAAKVSWMYGFTDLQCRDGFQKREDIYCWRYHVGRVTLQSRVANLLTRACARARAQECVYARSRVPVRMHARLCGCHYTCKRSRDRMESVMAWEEHNSQRSFRSLEDREDAKLCSCRSAHRTSGRGIEFLPEQQMTSNLVPSKESNRWEQSCTIKRNQQMRAILYHQKKAWMQSICLWKDAKDERGHFHFFPCLQLVLTKEIHCFETSEQINRKANFWWNSLLLQHGKKIRA